MKYEKYSFIGKIDRINEDFNNYFDHLDSLKNYDKETGDLLNPEFYLQTIINRKRPETAIPCNNRNNRKNSFEKEPKIPKINRIKTSTGRRISTAPLEFAFNKNMIFPEDNDNDNENEQFNSNNNGYY